MGQRISNESFTVTTTSLQIKPKCFQQRVAMVITNTSTQGQIISIGIGTEAVAGSGIQLAPGGTYQDTQDGQYKPSNEEVNVISSAANGTIAVHHRVVDGGL
jgi:hypothetical protein